MVEAALSFEVVEVWNVVFPPPPLLLFFALVCNVGLDCAVEVAEPLVGAMDVEPAASRLWRTCLPTAVSAQ